VTLALLTAWRLKVDDVDHERILLLVGTDLLAFWRLKIISGNFLHSDGCQELSRVLAIESCGLFRAAGNALTVAKIRLAQKRLKSQEKPSKHDFQA
jgi:hypothetical protein